MMVSPQPGRLRLRWPHPTLCLGVLLAALAVGCAHAEQATPGFFDADDTGSAPTASMAEEPAMGAAPMMDKMAAPMVAGAEPTPSPVPPEASQGAAPAGMPRLIIYTGNANVLVANVADAQKKLTERVSAVGGYIDQQNTDTASNTATLTFRVPAAQFLAFKSELSTLGEVLNDSMNAQDVTKVVFDLELRLDSATQARTRLTELLKQASKVEDIITIEAEVRRLTDEIEGLKGQLRYYKDQVAFSTLTVTLVSNAPPPTTGPARKQSRFSWINAIGPERVLYDF